MSATIKESDGRTTTIKAAYVAGCDGARSSVREMNGIAFPGAPYEHVFFVADTEVTGSMVPDEVNVYLWRNGFHLYFPMRGTDRWRVIGILPKHLQESRSSRSTDVVPSLRREGGDRLSFRSCSWFSTYRIHHRCTERFRNGRCFLLGDAAHIHSPMGGQGMNTGLQDAYNLGVEARNGDFGTRGSRAARQLRGRASSGSTPFAGHDGSGISTAGLR